ncbi:type II secretion system protein [Massilia endophytica]|uniref:type II secretion system protein n=1 Tax=Massilia endophytica TaxID=2899220 RepID=UPI001E54C09D|nr:type II secretion system protein [Massilia endophytica]UGQ48746.1 type II secretion system GspH family protein [Massilia endophytica]
MPRQNGFSYVVVMFLLAISAVVAVRALENTALSERRDKEAELLWRGIAYRNAIKQYYENSPGSGKAYPAKLENLLYDSRLVKPTRPLRKLYTDPMTDDDWGLVLDASNAVIGVYSKSNVKPIKQAGFPPELATFTGAQRYSDWKFIYTKPAP